MQTHRPREREKEFCFFNLPLKKKKGRAMALSKNMLGGKLIFNVRFCQ